MVKENETNEKDVTNEIEEHYYKVRFDFNKDGKDYTLKIKVGAQFYDIEENNIRIECENIPIYLTNSYNNPEVYNEVEDLLRDIFVTIHQKTNELMKSELLNKMQVNGLVNDGDTSPIATTKIKECDRKNCPLEY